MAEQRRNQNPEMPADTWPITKDDKVQMRELGRELDTFLHGYFKKREQEFVHIKIVVGAFNYVMDMQTQKGKLIADDFQLADRVVSQSKLTEKIEEPYDTTEVPEPTVEEKRKHLEDELSKLDVEEASPAPSASTLPPADGPSNS